ncbi:MAG: hypothetical protein AB1695_06520 [Stygiobacter sp.]
MVNGKWKMDNNLKKFLVLIIFSVFATGCVQTIKLGLVESNRMQEFYADDYKMRIRIIAIDDAEFTYSISFFDKNDNTTITDVKAEIDIKKYPQNPKSHFKHRHGKQMLVSGLKPNFDETTKDYDFKYKYSGKGKYELTIRLSEIDGKPLDKDLLISFNQEV